MNDAETKRINRQITGLSTLLQLEKEVRHVENLLEFGFVVTNEVYRLFPYRQAVFWQSLPSGEARVQAVSSAPDIDRNAPFIQWIEKIIKHQTKADEAQNIQLIDADLIPKKLREGWQDWMAPFVMWVPLVGKEGTIIGGIWFARDKAWDKSEMGLSEWLRDSFSYSMEALTKQKKIKISFRDSSKKKRVLLGSLAAVIILAFMPVDQTTLAPSEIIAKNPIVVASPVKGVVEKIHVKPNQSVEAGQRLLIMDETSIRNQYEVAQKSLDIAKEKYKKATQKAFLDSESRAQASILKAQMLLKQVELAYAKELLERIDVRADKQGIAIFDDPNEWEGRPVMVGEKIMYIADPKNIELELWLSVADAINLQAGAKVRVFFNIDPLNPYEAELNYASYEAEPTPDGVLAYRLKAHFVGDTPNIRIGLKGTAKVYGEKVSLFYYIMRRPMAAVRRIIGI